MVDFGGWDMPVQYSGIIDEHNAVRNAVGLFDVSHMGEIEIRGPEAAQAHRLRHHQRASQAQNRPGALLRPALRARRIRRRHPGPQSRRRPLLPLRQRLQPGEGFRAHPRRRTASTPKWSSPATATRRSPSRDRKRCATLQKLTPVDLCGIQYYWFADGEVAGVPARIARTGYTGEDGFEIYVAPAEAERDLGRDLERAREFGIKPCGLGARNTLRLEAKMALYGHEIDASISPLEADLGWIVKLDKGDFVGRDALRKAEGRRRHAQARRLRDARPRHRPRRLRSLARRRAGGLGHQRLARRRL